VVTARVRGDFEVRRIRQVGVRAIQACLVLHRNSGRCRVTGLGTARTKRRVS
jgi:hypothetical protein